MPVIVRHQDRGALRLDHGHDQAQSPAVEPHWAALAALELLSSADVARPVCLVVDDVQWIDLQSWEALAFLGRRLERAQAERHRAGHPRPGRRYVMTAKANMPTLYKQLKKLPWAAVPSVPAVSTDHGRRARRTIKAALAPAWIGFDGGRPVARWAPPAASRVTAGKAQLRTWRPCR
jgi:hypothetical protein